MRENPLEVTRRVVLRRGSRRRGYHLVPAGEGWIFRLEGPEGRAVETGVLWDPAAALDLRAEIDAALAVALAEGWAVDPAPRLRPVRPPRRRRERPPLLLAPVYAMDRGFGKGARRRRYVIRVNAAGWFRTQVWVNGTLHRTTKCYAEEEVRRLTRQFEREIADLLADGWSEGTRATPTEAATHTRPRPPRHRRPSGRSRP